MLRTEESGAPGIGSWLRLPSRVRPTDALAVAALLLLSVGLAWARFIEDWSLYRTDIVLFFLPMWGFLGERLRAGDIPGWNPAQFAGMPFAGDPESGWFYLPAMLSFTVLPPVAAFKAITVFHLGLAALTTFALGRVLGLTLIAAVAAAATYQLGTFLEFTSCCTVYVLVGAWLPLALLGVEMAVRAGDWLRRVAWWGVCGVAISQMLGGWLGQGSYYGLLLVGGYLAYRTLLPLEGVVRSVPARLGDLALHGASILALGFGLGAAGVLPRLEAISHSTRAGGVYDAAAAQYASHGGWTLSFAVNNLLSIEADSLRYYGGVATLALAIIAPLLARRHYAVPFFAAVTLAAFILALEPTPLHRLFALLPRFAVLHEHYSERVLIVFSLAAALLAGATVSALPRWRGRPWQLIAVGVLPFAALLWLRPRWERPEANIWPPTVVTAGIVALLLVLAALVRTAWARALLPVVLLVVVVADPTGWRLVSAGGWHAYLGERAQVALPAHASHAGAAGFLLARQEAELSRYAGYGPTVMASGSTYHFMLQEPLVPALLVNNRATTLGLADLSGYNPVQPARYRELVDALNRGQGQDYHQTNLLQGGLDSPLLDLLNVRYIVVPANAASHPDIQSLDERYPTVYQDAQVRVVENADAFPRAWLVHSATRVGPGAALLLVGASTVDLRTTAVLETQAPPLAAPTNPAADRVDVLDYAPDRIQLAAHSDAPSLLMLSEVYDPNWKAYVDGEETPVLVADHALRAVPLPAGEHTVELRFEPRALTIGLAISLGTAVLLIGTLVTLGALRWRRVSLARRRW